MDFFITICRDLDGRQNPLRVGIFEHKIDMLPSIRPQIDCRLAATGQTHLRKSVNM